MAVQLGLLARYKEMNMKKLLVLGALALSNIAMGSAFCSGYKDGYKAGYCHQVAMCMAPMAPMCPMPGMGETTYQSGYNRGFLAGLNAR